MSAASTAMEEFLSRSLEAMARARELGLDAGLAEAIPEWPSPCIPNGTSGMVEWQPVRQDVPWETGALEAVLGAPLHEDFAVIFGSWWVGASIDALFAGEEATLAIPRNRQERDRITASLCAELEGKRAEGLGNTLFFANTDSDLMWVMDLDEGSVWLEEVGQMPHERVAESLAEFLNRLKSPWGK